ncbi:MAG: RdgB/HAM1 family non-canonical purine NTP pyrophosphatase [Spirochaetia bacterium]|nr:RdgB/HAM1 family non-canonical purine NTP pyrophosphatase [Spirochaetia bacterium]
MTDIVLATNNRNKLKEIQHIIGAKAVVLSLYDIGFTGEIIEDGETLAENALIKARAVKAKAGRRVVIADDTGLEVDYLAKAPGVYSARFAGPGCDYMDNNRKLLKLMKGVKPAGRTAVFRTCVAVVYPDGKEEIYEGRVEGSITTAMKGANGFGYDPVFYVKSKKKTYAQMELKEKNSVSHRMKAVKKALAAISKRYGPK